MVSVRQHHRRAADQLRHLLDSDQARAMLTQDEIDMAAILRDRLYELVNRGRRRPPAE